MVPKARHARAADPQPTIRARRRSQSSASAPGPRADPFAVTGDFNAAEGNLAIRFLKGDAKIDGNTNEVPMRDTFRVMHPDADNFGTAHEP